jgi:ABC-2 type transport system ATP-binding protein
VSVRALDGVAGFVEAPRFYPYLSGRENLRMMAAYDGGDAVTRIDPSLDTVGLLDRAHDRVGGYSHGMRQRLGIAGALLRNPRLMLLDEPGTGLDPAGMRDMRDLVRQLASAGITVVLSSHLLPEVEELCNRVAIVRRGQMVYEGYLEELRRTAGSGYRLRTTDNGVAERVAAAQPGVANVRSADGELHFSADEPTVAKLSIALVESGAAILALTPELATLEQLFFRLTEGDESADGDPRELSAAGEGTA